MYPVNKLVNRCSVANLAEAWREGVGGFLFLNNRDSALFPNLISFIIKFLAGFMDRPSQKANF